MLKIKTTQYRNNKVTTLMALLHPDLIDTIFCFVKTATVIDSFRIWLSKETLRKRFKNKDICEEIRNGNFQATKFLIRIGIDDFSGNAIEMAIRFGNLDIIKSPIGMGNTSDDSIKYAAKNGDLEIIKNLILTGGEISVHSIGCTAFNGNVETIKLLIKSGGNLLDFAISRAYFNGRIEVVKFSRIFDKKDRVDGKNWLIW